MKEIASYKVRETLGVGGMGKVFKALSQSGAEVAIKTLKVDEPHLREGFRREIEALAELDHPGVVRIIDHGLETEPWYAMQLVEGTALSNIIERSTSIGTRDHEWWTQTIVDETPAWLSNTGPGESRASERSGIRLAEDAILRIGLSLSEALAHLHQHGLVHRDLKPANIIIEPSGNAVIVDFGIASWSAGSVGRERLEARHSAAGSLPWMSPEQIRGQWVSPRADLYSLGCVLYQMAAGRRVFEADKAMPLRMMHLRDEPEPLEEIRPGLDAELSRLIMRLLEKEPTDRPGYAYDVAARLASIAREEVDFGATPTLHRPRLAGRSEVLSRLLQATTEGQVEHVIRLSGPSGIGKTRLLIEASTVWTKASSVQGLICRPGLGSSITEVVAPAPGDSSIAASVEDRLEEESRFGPQIIVIDDAHHADPTTLEVVRYLAGSRSIRPWYLVVAYTTEEVVDELQSLGGPHFELGRLERDEIASLAASMLGHQAPEDLVDYLLETSDGLPYFAAETLRLLVSEGHLERDFESERWRVRIRDEGFADLEVSQNLSDLLERRLSALDEKPRRLVELVSVLGSRVPGEWVEVIAPELMRFVGETRRAEVLSFDTRGRLVFSQNRLRETAYRAISPGRRRALHARVADKIAELSSLELAHHLREAGQPARAAALYRSESARIAHEDASTYALAMSAMVECLEASGNEVDAADALAATNALIDAGFLARAHEMLESMQPDESALEDMRLLKTGEVAFLRSQHEQGLSALDTLLELDAIESVKAQAQYFRAQIFDAMGRYADSLDACRQAISLMRGDDSLTLHDDADDLELRVLVQAASTQISLGERSAPRRLLEALIEEYARRRDDRGRCYAIFEIVPLIALSRDAEYFGHYEKIALELARAIGDQRAEARALDMMGSSYLLRGLHEEALPWYRRALELARRLGLGSRMMRILANTAMTCSELGRNDEAESYFRQVLEMARESGQLDTEINATINLASCLAQQGEHEEARDTCRRAISLARTADYQQHVATALIDLAETERLVGHLDAANQAVDEAIELCEQFELTSDLWARLEKAKIATAAREFDVAFELIDQVWSEIAELEGDVGAAFVIAAEIALLRASGRDADARILEAREIASRLSGPRRIIETLNAFALSSE